VALSPTTLMLAVIGCFLGTIIGVAAGAWPVERGRDPDPADLHAGARCDLGAGAADVGLLRRDVWRADLVDPAQHPRATSRR
jgi:hypothetical protein